MLSDLPENHARQGRAEAWAWPLAVLAGGAMLTLLALAALRATPPGAAQLVPAGVGTAATLLAVLATALLSRARLRSARHAHALTAELGMLAQVARYTFNAVVVTDA